MTPAPTRPSSARRLFGQYVAVSLLPVIVLGLLLAASFRAQAQARGLGSGAATAALIGSTAIEPLLDGRDLRAGLPGSIDRTMRRVTTKAIADGSLVRLRLRDLDGRIIFSDDGLGEGTVDGDDEAMEAAEGEAVSRVTTLDVDSRTAGQVGAAGPQVVEAYRPLVAGPVSTRVGVLEVYLPYAPIRREIDEQLHGLYVLLAVGLGLLYLVLAAVSATATRRLRRESMANLHLAEHDHLTGLANRRVFDRRLSELGEGAHPVAAVAVIDIDRFREVNDTIGHQGGDEVILRLAQRLSEAIGPHDLIARLGGAEFGVVLAGVSTERAAEEALHRLRARITEPMTVWGVPLSAEASIGYALALQDGSGTLLLQRADIAMFAARTTHAGVRRYDSSADDYDSDRLALVGELRRALAGNELVLHYQPTLRLRDDEVRSVEALVRWHHPRHGLLYPDSFLPAAEQTGLIDPLTDWVLSTALEQVSTWDRAGAHVDVAVNISARNLTSPGFALRVLEAVQRSGLATRRLVLEVTETAVFVDVDRATTELRTLRDAGIRISLDDFGQGSTSLGYLGRLPLTELKIDRAFVTDMGTDGGHAAIVVSVIELAHNLGMSVVAEGVEDETTLETLRRNGCDIAQGYVLARPMPGAAVLDWLAARRPAGDRVPLSRG